MNLLSLLIDSKTMPKHAGKLIPNRLLSGPRILRGKQEKTWTNEPPHQPKVGVGGGCVENFNVASYWDSQKAT